MSNAMPNQGQNQQTKQSTENPSIVTKQETKTAPPQKLNPFNIPSSNPTSNTSLTSKPSGLPGAFRTAANPSNKSFPKSTSSVSDKEGTPIHHSNTLVNQPTSNTSLGNKPAPTHTNTNNMNSIMESLAGLDFSENSNASPQNNANTSNSNNLFDLYAQQSPYGMGNSPMSYPGGQDPNMGGFPMQQQPYYPYPQYNPTFNGSYNPQMYPPQFQGQYPPQYNYQPNYPMYLFLFSA